MVPVDRAAGESRTSGGLMEIEFLKMQGCGEDAILVDCFKRPAPEEALRGPLARRMLDRTRGVGAASLVLLAPGERLRLAARSLGPDGEEGPVSCNALRCAARYAADAGVVTEDRFTAETLNGRVAVQVIDSVNVRVDMGLPSGGRLEQIREEPLASFTRSLVIGTRSITYTPVSFGLSFGIVFVPAFDFPFRRTAREIVRHPEFPERTGVAFAQVCSREEIRLRVWEGTENASSCAAAAAAVVAAAVSGFSDREVFVHLSGGDLFIQWEERDNRLYVTGPAGYVFTGTYHFAEESD